MNLKEFNLNKYNKNMTSSIINSHKRINSYSTIVQMKISLIKLNLMSKINFNLAKNNINSLNKKIIKFTINSINRSLISHNKNRISSLKNSDNQCKRKIKINLKMILIKINLRVFS